MGVPWTPADAAVRNGEPLVLWHRDPLSGLRAAAGRIGDYVQLSKPRIVAELLVTALCAMVVAARGHPPLGTALAALVGLALSAGGANAINMWYDRDIDAQMARTRGRPLPTGRLHPLAALRWGIGLQLVAIPLLALRVNPLTALLTFAGSVYYALVYTMGLKRRTSQNIVIGGGAGAFPPLIGWAAVTGGLSWAAIWMFLIIFLWTPPHFWSLALYRQEEYRQARVPMLPVVHGPSATRWQILTYTLLLLPVSLLLSLGGVLGPVYLVSAGALGFAFIGHALALLRERPGETRWAKRTFRFSLLYLTAVFGAMLLSVRP